MIVYVVTWQKWFGFLINRRLVWRFRHWRAAWRASFHERARWSTWSVLWNRRKLPTRRPLSVCVAVYHQMPWLMWRWHNSSPAPMGKPKLPVKTLESPYYWLMHHIGTSVVLVCFFLYAPIMRHLWGPNLIFTFEKWKRLTPCGRTNKNLINLTWKCFLSKEQHD